MSGVSLWWIANPHHVDLPPLHEISEHWRRYHDLPQMPPCTGSKPYRSTSPTQRFSPARRRKWTQAPVLLKLVSNRASSFRYTLKRIYRAKGLFVTFMKIALKVKRLKLHRIKINSKNHPQSTHSKQTPPLNSLQTNTQSTHSKQVCWFWLLHAFWLFYLSYSAGGQTSMETPNVGFHGQKSLKMRQ